ncbi:glutaminyl-peptide cyclotransferase [Urechidicola vernalis]|uniref:Glutaminyl-peptide cyclotransferase n=1 Tax=Urechidicola vernalis TaxID=3075600 RepID=A0ABU2Y2V4_9FLAO|nr:glutaminyl-peptide cyclotransferase [Urechidicola sp. P050]MDT0552532.1 glutaminyl-peptide cyclotransferase [Urechidicola sp. P050]
MSLKHSLVLFVCSLFFISCETDYKFNIEAPKSINVNEVLSISFSEKNGTPFENVEISLDTEKLTLDENFAATIDISKYKLGKHTITAIVFYENQTKKITKPVYFLADTAPAIYTYNIINSYPHDKNAYTQGLEIHDGVLYESTGQYGTSSLRKVELKTGKVLKQIDLDQQYFGEGMTKFNDEIVLLTWKKGTGFVYDFETFEQKDTFTYNKEGWGLTNNGTHLIKTDGSERIQFLDPITKKQTGFIEAYTHKRKVENLNELEYVNGKIYANIYQQNSLLILDADTGKIEGIADLRGLRNKVEQHAGLDVLNGIAYDGDNDKLYVTGKNWSKLFEIELLKKD